MGKSIQQESVVVDYGWEAAKEQLAFKRQSAVAAAWRTVLVFLLAAFVWPAVLPSPVYALGGGAVTITLVTGNATTNTQALVSDSNNCAGGDGPHAAYVGVTITNASGAALTGLQATLSGLDTANGFNFAGGQGATQFVGALNNAESLRVFWFVQ